MAEEHASIAADACADMARGCGGASRAIDMAPAEANQGTWKATPRGGGTGAGVSFYTPQGYPYLGAGDATGTLPTIGKMYECEILAGSQRLFFNAALGAEHATQLQSGSLLFALNGDAEFVVP